METEDISANSPTSSKSKSVGLSDSPQPITDASVPCEDDLPEELKSNSREKDEIALNKPLEEVPINEGKNDIEGLQNRQPLEPKPDKPQGRKRKASEMKSPDENSLDEPPAKDKPGLKDDAVGDQKENKLLDKSSDDGMSIELKEMKDLETQTLGKGKRARIPNKRYSDFPLKSTRSSQAEYMDVEEKIKAVLENGEVKESVDKEVALNPDLTVKDDASDKSSSSSPNVVVPKSTVNLRANRTASPITPGLKKHKLPLDLTNPNYLKPFQFGWKRELVYRATNDAASNKRNGDIYYYTPNGKKVRSMREVSENLKNKELTLDDFTFFKEPLGLEDPEKEIIRDAKIKSAITMPATVKKSTPKVTKTPKISSPKLTTPPPTDSPAPVKPKFSPRKSAFKIKLPTGGPQKKSKTEKKNSKNDSDMEIGLFPPNWTSPIAKKTNKTTNNSTIQVSGGTSPTAISENISIAQQRPQHVEFLGNKQFLIIPKQNILAISPNIPTSATALTNKPISNNNGNTDTSPSFKVAAEGSTNIANIPDSASLGPPVEVSTIKNEPSSPLKCTDPHPITPQERTETESSELIAIQHNTLEKRPQENPDDDQENKRKKPKLTGLLHPHTGAEAEDAKFMDSYLQNVAYGYNTLLYVFQYLKMQDLLRASCVCSMWRDIASHPMLWKTVRMKNSQIHSFEGLADALEKHGTSHLDLRKMLLPSTSNDDIWLEFSRAIKKVDSLRKIELCRCPATVVEQLALSNPKLEVINSVTIKCESMSLAPLVFLKNLQELRLKSTAGFSLTSDLTALSDLKQLKHLSLTSIKELNKLNINVIADLRNLESLELGECTDFPKTFGSEILTRLSKLEKLRLEKGQGNCYTFEVLEAVKNMPHLYQLELVNFDIKPGFDLALGACPNIKKLLIIPTYISQSATTNHMVLGGVLRLQSTLSQFVWGVTLELLRVTELFVDQCEEDKDKKEKRPMSNGDSIPVLKPVPLAREGMTAEILPAQEPPQVEILPLPNLQKLLLSSLPTTRVKILKIPFHATWRQSIHDSVN